MLGGRSFWQSVAALTSVGWSIALPVALGVLLGRWIDRELSTGFFWTLTLLGLGTGIGAMSAYLSVRAALREQERG